MISAATSGLTLAELATSVDGASVVGDASVSIFDVAFDSREVSAPGTLFFCVAGLNRDGSEFAPQAISSGAVALVVERPIEGVAVPQMVLPSVRDAMGPLSAQVFGQPSKDMKVAGVTGTNGKTTTTYILDSIFRRAGLTTGLIGTTGSLVAGQKAPLERTTPEAPDLQRLFLRMREAGVSAVAMEVSSHALEMRRVDGIRFDAALFTNLSLDHLDFHPTMREYFEAKSRLFTPGFCDHAVVNVDDEWGRRLADSIRDLPVTTFALEPGQAGAHLAGMATTTGVDVVAGKARSTADGVSFEVDGTSFISPLRGAFNLYNCLSALVTARAMGFTDPEIADGLAAVGTVPGRAEMIDEGQGFLVMVDYAHTPDSIRNVLGATLPLVDGRVIVVFGCGGDRDRDKRPLMGSAAVEGSSLAIITTDNPRSEDPASIIGSVLIGARQAAGGDESRFLVEPDRRSAIRLALREAGPHDAVVIAGKGHETYQEFADRKVHFDDREVVAEELRALMGGAA